jgi:hypothetical protein
MWPWVVLYLLGLGIMGVGTVYLVVLALSG